MPARAIRSLVIFQKYHNQSQKKRSKCLINNRGCKSKIKCRIFLLKFSTGDIIYE